MRELPVTVIYLNIVKPHLCSFILLHYTIFFRALLQAGAFIFLLHASWKQRGNPTLAIAMESRLRSLRVTRFTVSYLTTSASSWMQIFQWIVMYKWVTLAIPTLSGLGSRPPVFLILFDWIPSRQLKRRKRLIHARATMLSQNGVMKIDDPQLSWFSHASRSISELRLLAPLDDDISTIPIYVDILLHFG